MRKRRRLLSLDSKSPQAMQYNSKRSSIRIPEYGRFVQQMVEQAILITDRAERQKVAEGIITTMMRLVPKHRQGISGKQVYWDHLAIISDFRLDIDYPEGTTTEERAKTAPARIPYNQRRVRYRYYGEIVLGMIQRVRQMPMGRERAMLEYFIAQQMKRNYMTWNSETVQDLKIFSDLYEMSEGEILLTPENCKLNINPNSIDRHGKQKVGKKQLGPVKPSYSSSPGPRRPQHSHSPRRFTPHR